MIIGFIIGAVMAVLLIIAENTKRKRMTVSAQRTQEQIAQQQKDPQKWLISNITEDMALIGGDEWDSSIHQIPGQYDRMKRASFEGEYGELTIVLYDKGRGIAKMRGSKGKMYLVSGLWCSCMDYRRRGLPCKHMYLLAMEHPEESILSYSNDEFSGLTFALAGYKQAPIKKYIEDHGGGFDRFHSYDTTALVKTSDDVETQITSYAQVQRVFTLTGEELMELFREGT
ncbi:MAG: SWIM zinc finger family protein [Clostridia bacterium]|nr:SWIM zinc finger family protein [Clostridia bacterium]